MLRLSPNVTRAVLQLVCALVLFAQHVALAHSVLHAYRHGLAQQELGVQVDRSHRQHAPKVSKLCAFDAMLGQVLGCASPPADFSASTQVRSECVAFIGHRTHSGEFLAPLSRGPPPLS